MPLYYDYEYSSADTRLYVYAEEGNRENLTQVLNYAMNKLRLETEHEVCLYSDKNALNDIFNYDCGLTQDTEQLFQELSSFSEEEQRMAAAAARAVLQQIRYEKEHCKEEVSNKTNG